MTEATENKKSRLREKRHVPDLFGLSAMTLLILFLCYAKEGPALVAEGLILCAHRVIPSLFPFMVISAMILSSGVLLPLSRRLSRPLYTLFGIGGDSGCAWLLGLACGFPVGASSGIALYEEGRIDEREFSRLMTLVNQPSPTFLLLGVGASLFNDALFGVLLCSVTLCSSILIGIAERLWFGSVRTLAQPSAPPSSHVRKRSSLLFTEAVTSSARSMLSVCAFVVFFYTLTGILSNMITLSPVLHSLLLGFFEMTGGMASAASCPSPLSYVLAAILAGWSGLSVHFQIMSVCPHSALSFRPYLVAKGIQGILNGLLMPIALLVFGYV